jgi:hypothetical protein
MQEVEDLVAKIRYRRAEGFDPPEWTSLIATLESKCSPQQWNRVKNVLFGIFNKNPGGPG